MNWKLIWNENVGQIVFCAVPRIDLWLRWNLKMCEIESWSKRNSFWNNWFLKEIEIDFKGNWKWLELKLNLILKEVDFKGNGNWF